VPDLPDVVAPGDQLAAGERADGLGEVAEAEIEQAERAVCMCLVDLGTHLAGGLDRSRGVHPCVLQAAAGLHQREGDGRDRKGGPVAGVVGEPR